MEKARIAELNVYLECQNKEYFAERFAAYRVQDAGEPDLFMRTKMAEGEINIDGEVLSQTDKNRIVRVPDGRLCVCNLSGQNGEITAATYYNDDYSQAEIVMLDCGGAEYQRQIEYQKTYYAFSNRVLTSGGLALHGSAVCARGKAVIFSAPSGTGKSTHAGLWQKYLDEPITVINDDRPILRFDNAVPQVYGAPWSGKSDINANISAPLAAIVVLRQAKGCAIEELSVAEKMFCLAGETARPFFDQQLSMLSLNAIEKLALSVPMYRLYCDISKNAVDICYRAVFGD